MNRFEPKGHNQKCMFEGCNNIAVIYVKATIGIEKKPVDLYLCVDHQKELIKGYTLQQSVEFKMTDLKGEQK